MFQLRGNSKGCVVIDSTGDEFKFRAGEFAGLYQLIRRMNLELFVAGDSRGALLEEYREAIRWYCEHQHEIPKMTETESRGGEAKKPPFMVGRKYDDWAVGLLTECEKAIEYINQELATSKKKTRRGQILRAIRSDLRHVVSWLKEGTAGNRWPVTWRSKIRREILMEPSRIAKLAENPYYNPYYMDKKADADRKLVQLAFKKAGLTPREREIYELKYGQMMSEGEIAELLGVNIKTVSSLLVRSRKKIKKCCTKMTGCKAKKSYI